MRISPFEKSTNQMGMYVCGRWGWILINLDEKKRIIMGL